MGVPVQSRFSHKATKGSASVGAIVCPDHPALPIGLNMSKKAVVISIALSGVFSNPDSAHSVAMRLVLGITLKPKGIGIAM